MKAFKMRFHLPGHCAVELDVVQAPNLLGKLLPNVLADQLSSFSAGQFSRLLIDVCVPPLTIQCIECIADAFNNLLHVLLSPSTGLFCLPLFTDIVKNDYCTDDRSLRVSNWGSTGVNGYFPAISRY